MTDNKPFYALHSVNIKKTIPYEEALNHALNITNKKNLFHRETKNIYRFRNIPKTKFNPKTYRTKKVNKNISLVFGELKPEFRHLEGSGLSDIIKSGYEKVKGFFSPREDFNNMSRKTLSQFGESKIKSLQIMRTPIVDALNTILNVISLGKWNKVRKEVGYDKLFHLALVASVETPTGLKNIILEKNETVDIGTSYKTSKDTETFNVPLQFSRGITLNQLVQNTLNKMGKSNFFRYDAFINNCQVFIRNLLSSSGLLTTDADKFLFQPLDEVIKKVPSWVQPISRAITDIAAVGSKIIGKGNKCKCVKKCKCRLSGGRRYDYLNAIEFDEAENYLSDVNGNDLRFTLALQPEFSQAIVNLFGGDNEMFIPEDFTQEQETEFLQNVNHIQNVFMNQPDILQEYINTGIEDFNEMNEDSDIEEEPIDEFKTPISRTRRINISSSSSKPSSSKRLFQGKGMICSKSIPPKCYKMEGGAGPFNIDSQQGFREVEELLSNYIDENGNRQNISWLLTIPRIIAQSIIRYMGWGDDIELIFSPYEEDDDSEEAMAHDEEVSNFVDEWENDNGVWVDNYIRNIVDNINRQIDERRRNILQQDPYAFEEEKVMERQPERKIEIIDIEQAENERRRRRELREEKEREEKYLPLQEEKEREREEEGMGKVKGKGKCKKGTKEGDCFKKGLSVGYYICKNQKPPLEKLRLRELGEIARNYNITRYGNMKRQELIDALKAKGYKSNVK